VVGPVIIPGRKFNAAPHLQGVAEFSACFHRICGFQQFIESHYGHISHTGKVLVGFIGKGTVVKMVRYHGMDHYPPSYRDSSPGLYGIKVFIYPGRIIENTVPGAILLGDVPQADEIIVQPGTVPHTASVTAAPAYIAHKEGLGGTECGSKRRGDTVRKRMGPHACCAAEEEKKKEEVYFPRNHEEDC